MSLFKSDEALPTWLHSLFILILVSMGAIPLLYAGVVGILTLRLEPFSGTEFGSWLIPKVLTGGAAIWGGIALLVLSSAYYSVGFLFSRFYDGQRVYKCLPWGLLALHCLIMWGLNK